VPGIGGYFKFLFILGSNAQFFHEAFHSFSAAAYANFEQVAMDTRTAVIAPAPVVNL
jgi:hypothetical protein